MMLLYGYLGLVALLSLATFAFYGWDKRQAKIDGWRVTESKLTWLALLGGWPGAMAGQRFFRHKTRKVKFRIVNFLSLLIHGGVLSLLIYRMWK